MYMALVEIPLLTVRYSVSGDCTGGVRYVWR